MLSKPASAFHFCAISINVLQARQFRADEPYRKATDTTFGVELQADEALSAEAVMSIVAGGQLYHVPLGKISFLEDSAHLAERGYVAAPIVFSFARPTTVDYAWISSVNAYDSQTTCPLDPFHASHEYFNDPTLASGDRQRRIAANTRVLAALRTSRELHPIADAHLSHDCANPDQHPSLLRGIAPRPGNLAALKGPTAVSALVFLSPMGDPLDVQLVESSSFPDLNAAVLNSARASTYNPAVIDCMPSAGVFLFRAVFQT